MVWEYSKLTALNLGVIIDNKLSWKPQISSLSGKLSQSCGVVCKIRHFADMNSLRLIYFRLFHSHLQYRIIDWGRAYKTVIRQVQMLQNRIWNTWILAREHHVQNNIFKLLKILKVSDLYQLYLEKFNAIPTRNVTQTRKSSKAVKINQMLYSFS